MVFTHLVNCPFNGRAEPSGGVTYRRVIGTRTVFLTYILITPTRRSALLIYARNALGTRSVSVGMAGFANFSLV
jgi:hypothetical protein